MSYRDDKLVGYVGVDSGSVWLGDPAYVIGNDASHNPGTWDDYIEKLFAIPNWGSEAVEPLGGGVGITVGTLYGDGEYPVYAEVNERGQIVGLRVDFDPREEREVCDYCGEYDHDEFSCPVKEDEEEEEES